MYDFLTSYSIMQSTILSHIIFLMRSRIDSLSQFSLSNLFLKNLKIMVKEIKLHT